MSAAPDGDLALEIDGSITCDDLRTWRVYWHSPTLSFRLSVSYPTPGELLVEKFDVARKDEDWPRGDRYSGRSPEVSVRKVTMLVNAWHICRKGGRRRKPSYCYLLAISHEDTRVCQSARRLKPEQQFSRRVVGTEVSLTSQPAALM